MYIVSWRQTSPLATIFEAAMKDHFEMLSDLDEVILHASSLLAEQRRCVQMIARIAKVANTSLCAKWANRSSSPLVIVNPARCKCVVHQATIRELLAFASDARQTISMVQADLQRASSQIRYYREQPVFLGTKAI